MAIYFDNAATTKASPGVCEAVNEVLVKDYYNPSSSYSAALDIDKKLEASRETILKNLNMQGNLIFTSGGTESNNIAIFGALKKMKSACIITSETEHPSVKKTCIEAASELGRELKIIPVDIKGHIKTDEYISACKKADSAFVSIMHVNNETGTVQDIECLAEIAKQNIQKCVFHSDGVQAFMKVDPLNKNSKVDLYSLSAHKIHGPKGVGALYLKDKSILSAASYGGGQEYGLRSGTHNTPGIYGMAKAADELSSRHDDYIATMRNIKKIIIDEFKGSNIDYIICGDSIEKSAPHILNVAFRDIMGEVLLSASDSDGLIANTGSACSSKKRSVSPVLKAMNIDPNYIQGAMRLSFGVFSTEDEARQAAQIIINNVKRLRRFKRA
ncbi:MAG: cysteine desulfurase [Clostridia bacterium]|nr:cysteine desulfurase [Clostridia bacterium]